MQRQYDVVIVGAGPAGIFSALTLAESSDLAVAIVERGPDSGQRYCAMRQGATRCLKEEPCALLSGWGGAGAFCDGKLNLSLEIGGRLADYIGKKAAAALIEHVDATYRRFGAPDRIFAPDSDMLREARDKAVRAEMQLLSARVRHLGTDNCPQIMQRMREAVDGRVAVYAGTDVEHIVTDAGTTTGVRLRSGDQLAARYVVLAPGRSGAAWLATEAERLGIDTLRSPVDVGVRVEVPAALMDHLTSEFYEVKLLYHSKSFDTLVRTFCMCPHGEVTMEHTAGIISVNGHSWADKPTRNTNFALLCSNTFTEPFKQPIEYGQNIARLANMLGDGVLVQRLGDLRRGRRSTHARLRHSPLRPTLPQATPGDLSFVLPHRHLSSILEMLDALEALAPGVAGRHTLLYGVEVKFYSSRLKLSDCLETQVQNLFAIGDGAGVSRGLVQASACGVVAAREIIRRAH